MRDYLEEILIVNPGHRLARRKLAILDGRLNKEEIIDANKYEMEISAETEDVKGERFVCPNCGGRMVYTPQGDRLVCEYCEYTPQFKSDKSTLLEQDFIVGMATAKGHSLAVSTKAFDCSACGAVYLISPETLSLICAHCDSSYVLKSVKEKELIPPHGIIPFASTKDDVEATLIAWVMEESAKSLPKVDKLRSVYLPVWTFDVRGEVPYTHEEHGGRQLTNATKSVFFDDLLIPAGKPLPRGFEEMVTTYELDNLEPFHSKYLSNWLAESYQINLSDGAVQARAAAVEQTKQQIINGTIYKPSGLKIKSAYLFIDSYKLILLPVWMARYRLGKHLYEVLINGQTHNIFESSIIKD